MADKKTTPNPSKKKSYASLIILFTAIMIIASLAGVVLAASMGYVQSPVIKNTLHKIPIINKYVSAGEQGSGSTQNDQQSSESLLQQVEWEKQELAKERQNLIEEKNNLIKKQEELAKLAQELGQIKNQQEDANKNMLKMARVYAEMSAEDAAAILAKQDINFSAKVLSKMEDKVAARILAAMEDRDRAAQIIAQLGQ